MRRLRDAGRTLAKYVVRQLWLSLEAFGAAHDPFAAHYPGQQEPPRPHPAGPPPCHPERLREDIPLTGEELRILHELWPAYYAQPRTPDGT